MESKTEINHNEWAVGLSSELAGKLAGEGKQFDTSTFEGLRDFILDEEKKNRVVFQNIEGIHSVDVDALIDNQPIEGVLYDINRSREVILTFIKELKWVNDYACMLIINKLSERAKEARKEGIKFTVKLLNKHVMPKTFNDSIKKEVGK